MNIELARIADFGQMRTLKITSLALVCSLIVSGCASSGAPAPVEQRSSASGRAPAGGYRQNAPPRYPSPEPTRNNADRTVQITGLGDDSVQTESGTAWSEAKPAAASADAVRADAVPAPAPVAKSAVNDAPTTANPAVVALLNRANRESNAGRQGASAASLERAIKIEPGNAWLWHRLAQTRLKQNKPGEAASIAARSNSLAGSNDALRARNWRLIASVHDLRGESVAAQAARNKAERLERGTS